MIRLFDETRELGGRDPIDTAVPGPPPPAIRAGLGLLVRTRVALGLRPVVAPALLFVPIGTLLGPRGLDLISSRVLAQRDVLVSLALATLGIFVGVALDLRGRGDVLLLGVAAVEAATTVSVR